MIVKYYIILLIIAINHIISFSYNFYILLDLVNYYCILYYIANVFYLLYVNDCY